MKRGKATIVGLLLLLAFCVVATIGSICDDAVNTSRGPRHALTQRPVGQSPVPGPLVPTEEGKSPREAWRQASVWAPALDYAEICHRLRNGLVRDGYRRALLALSPPGENPHGITWYLDPALSVGVPSWVRVSSQETGVTEEMRWELTHEWAGSIVRGVWTKDQFSAGLTLLDIAERIWRADSGTKLADTIDARHAKIETRTLSMHGRSTYYHLVISMHVDGLRVAVQLTDNVYDPPEGMCTLYVEFSPVSLEE